ncbi:MAG: zinc transporter ZupT [Elusimicrobia bacterium RIFOXYB2_FULL_62_6]|nr:MAG: zinc transporter ZupT [Elusimicrobia bacterium RIFOXYB2_FULL_62_6]
MVHSPWFALMLSALAGLATGIGGIITFFTKHTSRRFLSSSLGFSAGVMIYISLSEMLPDARRLLSAEMGGRAGGWAAALAFFTGIAVTALIDFLVPEPENPHEPHNIEETSGCPPRLLKTGIITALAITIHNFPEGIATMMTALHDTHVGVAIAFAVGMHNIPEGIAVAVPIYCATKSRAKALAWSFGAGLTEPIGAAIAYLLLAPYLGGTMLGLIFGVVAGIMVFISFDELLPSAHEYGHHHYAVYGLISGMAVMAVSLIAFEK